MPQAFFWESGNLPNAVWELHSSEFFWFCFKFWSTRLSKSLSYSKKALKLPNESAWAEDVPHTSTSRVSTVTFPIGNKQKPKTETGKSYHYTFSPPSYPSLFCILYKGEVPYHHECETLTASVHQQFLASGVTAPNKLPNAGSNGPKMAVQLLLNLHYSATVRKLFLRNNFHSSFALPFHTNSAVLSSWIKSCAC